LVESLAYPSGEDGDNFLVQVGTLCDQQRKAFGDATWIMKINFYSFSKEICNCSQPTLQRTNAENSKQIFPEKELRGHSPNFHIHESVSDLYIPTIDLPILLHEKCGPILGIYKSLTDMNVEIGTEPAQFITNGIFVAV
jgi:hypothetical protein